VNLSVCRLHADNVATAFGGLEDGLIWIEMLQSSQRELPVLALRRQGAERVA
jgi:hypothetical protein